MWLKVFLSFFFFLNWSQGKESSREGSQSKETESPKADQKAQTAKTHQKTKSAETHKEAKGAQGHQETKGSNHSAAQHQASVCGGRRGEADDWAGLGHVYVNLKIHPNVEMQSWVSYLDLVLDVSKEFPPRSMTLSVCT